MRGALVQSGRSECGREFVRRACFPRFPACSPAPPRFEWRAARLRLCPGDECLKGRRSGGVPGGQARGPEAAPSQRYPSGVGRPTFTKVRLKSRAERPSRGWKEAGLEAGRGPVLGQGVRRSCQPRGPYRRCPARPCHGLSTCLLTLRVWPRPAPLSQPRRIVTTLWKSWGRGIFGEWNPPEMLEEVNGLDLSWFLEHSAGR